MPPSLSIEVEWIDQPLATDCLERRTWADLRIRARGRAVTRVWDHQSQAERTAIFIPAFPVAEWIIQNWWSLLYEPNLSDEVPVADPVFEPQRDWLRRHCLRAAEAGLLLPRLCIFGDGDRACIDWSADGTGAYPHMPAEFRDKGRMSLSRSSLGDALAEFVKAVIERVQEHDDPRVGRLCADWQAIRQAEPDERAFCQLAGRLGLDPYSVDQWEPATAEFLETKLGTDADDPLIADFLDAADKPTQISETWSWIQETVEQGNMKAAPQSVSVNQVPLATEQDVPANAGYRLAAQIRERLEPSTRSSMLTLDEAASAAGIGLMRFEDSNDLRCRSKIAIVGWSDGRTPTIVRRHQPRSDSRRFLEARGLYLALSGCQNGPRLATSGHTWNQKASRAFAAELLAPRRELSELLSTSSIAESDDPNSVLAVRFDVSTEVIAWQLKNAGMGRPAE